MLAELVIRGLGRQAPGWLRTSAAMAILSVSLVIIVATVFATRIMWAGPILGLLRLT